MVVVVVVEGGILEGSSVRRSHPFSSCVTLGRTRSRWCPTLALTKGSGMWTPPPPLNDLCRDLTAWTLRHWTLCPTCVFACPVHAEASGRSRGGRGRPRRWGNDFPGFPLWEAPHFPLREAPAISVWGDLGKRRSFPRAGAGGHPGWAVPAAGRAPGASRLLSVR